MDRLTDDRTAEGIKHICDGLIAAGAEPAMSDQRYIRLAEYERTGLAPDEIQQAWISVKERLPENETEVLIYCPEFVCTIKLAMWIEDGFYADKEDLIVKAAPNGYCTHWMPLPEPPEPLKEETYGKRETLLCWSKQGLYPDGFGGVRVGYTCPYCHKYVPYAGKYCGKCGERVAGGDE